MSKFVRVRTQLRDLALIKLALDDVGVQYRENAQYVHRWSGFTGQAPLLISQRGLSFGLREGQDGQYEVMGDDMQMKAIRQVMDQVQQRYAYRQVLAETAKAGFALVEETVGDDDVIRLTVRRWA